jgi:hypothetical protein
MGTEVRGQPGRSQTTRSTSSMTETQLQTVPLGSTDMSISRVGFGAWATDQHQHHVQ